MPALLKNREAARAAGWKIEDPEPSAPLPPPAAPPAPSPTPDWVGDMVREITSLNAQQLEVLVKAIAARQPPSEVTLQARELIDAIAKLQAPTISPRYEPKIDVHVPAQEPPPKRWEFTVTERDGYQNIKKIVAERN